MCIWQLRTSIINKKNNNRLNQFSLETKLENSIENKLDSFEGVAGKNKCQNIKLILHRLQMIMIVMMMMIMMLHLNYESIDCIVLICLYDLQIAGYKFKSYTHSYGCTMCTTLLNIQESKMN